MCLSIPAQIKSINNSMAVVTVSGNELQVNVQLIDSPQVGEYVLIHSGIAIEKINQEEAEYNLNVLRSLGEETNL